MHRIFIKDLLNAREPAAGINVAGWVRSKRTSKAFAFLVLNDGSCQGTLQVIVDAESPAFQLLQGINTGAAVRVRGDLRESPGGGQKWEMQAHEIEVFGDADPEKYPLQKKGHSLEFLREIAHLRPRTNTFGAMFRLRHVMSQAVHEFFSLRNFYWVHTPILTASDCEGAGEMFSVTSFDIGTAPRDKQGLVDYSQDFFGKKAHLSVSGQLEAEYLAMALGNVYTFGPTFRAENSNTSRHLSEFWMIEPEMAFADLNDDMDLAESFFKFVLKRGLEQCAEELEFFEKQYKNISVKELDALANTNFARISYTEAIAELEKAKKPFVFPVSWGIDLQSEHERYLTDEVFQKPVIVRNYPKDIKAFYMKLNPDEKTVAAMDVLVPKVGELIGGSQREDSLDRLTSRMAAMGVDQLELDWYLDLRRFGSAPHAGFGLGFERLLLYITGMQNIRDVIPSPRVPNYIKF